MDTTTTFRSQAAAMLMIAEAAHSHDLPDPWIIYHATSREGMDLQFRSMADLTAWAEWADEPVDHRPHGGSIHHVVDRAVIYDVPMQLTYIARAAVTA